MSGTEQPEYRGVTAVSDPDLIGIEQLRTLLQNLEDRHYLLITEPSQETAVRAGVEARGWAGFVAVAGSPTCPPGQILMSRIDPLQWSMLHAPEAPDA